MQIHNLENLPVSKLKSQMFNFYSLVEDFEQYNKINERALKYRDNVRDIASIEDITI